jgi:hypothetical protein
VAAIIVTFSPDASMTPPVGLHDNMRFRDALERRMHAEEGVRRAVWARCRKDVCYFVNTLGWTLQAKPYPLNLPMILYPLQTRYMKLLQKYGGRRHFHSDKSRDMGLTWCSLFWIFWHWLFTPRAKFHLASWKEWLVDQRWHPGTHFAKLYHMLTALPDSVRPNIRRGHERRKMMLEHPGHHSVITGESTSTRMGHQDRNLAALLDEFALMGQTPQDGYAILGGIRPTTDCMLIQSTPKGLGNAFAEYRTNASVLQSSFWWPDHPYKGRGLSGPGLADKPASGFWSDGVENLRERLTSPWYEKEKAEAVNAQEIAQEIDIDYAGSGWQFFEEVRLRRILVEDIMPPFHEGELVLDPDSGSCKGFTKADRGPLKLWCHPNRNGFPSAEFDYVIGADIAAGSRDSSGAGWSNSCAAVLNKQNGELVAEYVVHGVDAADFAVIVVALCRFFRNAALIWEGNGPGLHFTRVVTDQLRYGNIYYRKSEKKVTHVQTMEPGWWSMPTTKYWLMMAYREALMKGYTVERCKEAITELRMYQQTPTGVVHATAVSTPDPTGARENHADRVIARALAYRMMVEGGYNPLDSGENERRIIAPANSVAALREMANKKRMAMEIGY